jgi:uncharacterized membrane protein YhfC
MPRMILSLLRRRPCSQAPWGGAKDENQPFLVCPEDLKLVSTRSRWQITYLVIARMVTVGFGLALLFIYHLSAVDAQMSSLVHAIPPHAQVGDSPARLRTVLLIAVVTCTAFLIPRQIW